MALAAPPATALGPVPPSSLLDAGATHSVQVRPDGTLWAWGQTSAGQFGELTWPLTVPAQVGTDADWEQVSAGSSFTLAIKSDGTLWAWGVSFYGRLGLGEGVLNQVVPVQVGTDTDWKTVSAGRMHSLAIKQDGSLWAWGYNGAGAVGDGTVVSKWVPTRVGTENDWETVSGGFSSSAALKEDGSLWRWGNGVSAPVRVSSATPWRSVSMGYLGIKTDGSLWQLGGVPTATPVRIGTDSDWSSASAGLQFSTATKTDGSLWSWGIDDNSGQLGYGVLPYERYDTTSPQRVGKESDWVAPIAASSGTHGFAVKADGSVWGWGQNYEGEVGDGTQMNRSAPVRVGGPANTPPVAVDDTVIIEQNTQFDFGPALTDNDTDVDGDALIPSPLSSGANGEIAWLVATGGVAYIPDPGFVGTDYFTYQAWDGNEYSAGAPATVAVIVVPVLDTTPPEQLPYAVTSSSVTTSSFDVTWWPAYDSESGVAEYRVYLDGALKGSVTETGFAFDGLSPWTVYRVQIEAVDASGNVAPKTGPLPVSTKPAPVTPGSGPAATLEARLSPSYLDFYGAYGGAYFGESVAIDGDTIAVGDHLMGAMAAYDRTGSAWTESVLFREGHIGYSAAVSGADIAGGNRSHDPVRIVSRTAGAWDVAGASTLPGQEVAMNGDLAVTTDMSTVRVFRRSSGTWSSISEIPLATALRTTPPDVEIEGTSFAVADSGSGEVRVFAVVGDVVSEQPPIAIEVNPNFGLQLAMSGDTIAVCGYGQVDTYRRTGETWAHEQEITASGMSQLSQFGKSGVALEGDTLIVGDRRDLQPDEEHMGSAVVFTRSGGQWTQRFKILCPSIPMLDEGGNLRDPRFGNAIAIDGDTVVIGAMSETLEDGRWSGAAYVYRLSGLTDSVTPSGDNVEVTLTNGIKLIFSHVNAPGHSSAGGLTPRHVGETSATVVPGHYYDIHTDVDFTGPVTVVVPYDPSKITGDATRLKLRHWNGTTAEDITTSIDTVNHTVTGQTTSFSDYWIEEPPGSGVWVLVSAAADLPPAGYVLAFLGVVAGLVWLRRRAA